jgi:phosphoribosylamine--glycine ligase
MRVLLVGGGAREHAIAAAIHRSPGVELWAVASNRNPGIAALAHQFKDCSERNTEAISRWAHENAIDLAVIGLEDPLDAGLPDALEARGIPTVGPSRRAAQVETSKLFTRELMRRHDIPGQVEYRCFTDPDALRAFLLAADREFAIKPLGLTAGKGVKVMGVHLGSAAEAADYGQQVIESKLGGAPAVLVEERLIGEEFTLQAFVDSATVLPMPLVQDYKRAFEGDEGPNTGSMGSYSQADGLLLFVGEADRDHALAILRQVVDALRREDIPYHGVMYGQFMMTRAGIKLVEINARFGDPEAVNVLPLLQTDFVDVCRAVTSGGLRDLKLQWARKATVCKYITPPGYGVEPRVGVALRLDRQRIEALGVQIYFAKVDERDGAYLTSTSRSIALVGIADSVDEAEAAVEKALAHVTGEYHVRHDIGKAALRRRALSQLGLSSTSLPAMSTCQIVEPELA